MRVAIDARKIGDFGIGTYIRGLLDGLGAIGAAGEIVVLAPPETKVPAGMTHVVVDAPHYSFRELYAVGRAAERAGAGLLHAPHYVVPWTDLPVVVTIHDLIHLHQPLRNPLARLYARKMLGRAARKAERILTVSHAVAEELVAELGCDRSRIEVTPNGIDDRFRTSAPHPTAPHPTEEAPRFLFVGNDKAHKNVARLVEAFAAVRRERADATLILAGSDFARWRGAAGIDVRGFVSDDQLVNLYRNATALVLPSLEEGFGLPAAEAMACGTPVITSDSPALIEVTGDAAIHVRRDSAAELTAAMLQLSRDPQLRRSMAERGLARSAAFTWRRCAELTLAVYRNVAQR